MADFCKCCGKQKRKVLTLAEFKKKFKVGSVIYGWATGKCVTITAIGEKRFLYSEERHGKITESVGTIENTQAAWREKP